MKKIRKIITAVIVIIVVIAAVFAGIKLSGRKSTLTVMTSSDLEEAIMISELSTAEFVYNGIAVKPYEANENYVACYIAYNATVKVGIDMEDVKFDVDDETMTVTVTLPEVEVNIATVDEDSLSYIPQDPDVSLSEVITLCKEDALTEAAESEVLYETAEDNLKSVIEALITPLLESAGYELVWG